jgi:hypothetical protein
MILFRLIHLIHDKLIYSQILIIMQIWIKRQRSLHLKFN